LRTVSFMHKYKVFEYAVMHAVKKHILKLHCFAHDSRTHFASLRQSAQCASIEVQVVVFATPCLL